MYGQTLELSLPIYAEVVPNFRVLLSSHDQG